MKRTPNKIIQIRDTALISHKVHENNEIDSTAFLFERAYNISLDPNRGKMCIFL